MLQQVFNTLIAASIYALFAMGYALVFGVLDILNLAHGAIFMCGAFAAVQAVLGWHWPLLLALPFGSSWAGLLGVVLDLVAVAPLTTRGGDFPDPVDQHHRGGHRVSKTSPSAPSDRMRMASHSALFRPVLSTSGTP